MRLRIYLLFVLLILLSIGCTLSLPADQPAPATIDQNLLPTMVAGTLTASVAQASGTASSDPLSMAATATALMATIDANAAAAGATLTAASAAPLSGADPGAPALTQAAPPAAPTAGALPYVAPPAAFDAGLLRIAYFDGAGLQLWTEGGARKLLYSGEPVSSVAISR